MGNKSLTTTFYDKMKKQNLKTFSNIKRKHADKAQGKKVIPKVDRNLFGHIKIVAQHRQLYIRDVLAHPLGPLPWALLNGDGSLCKTNKASLARELENSVSPAEAIPEQSACIIDEMSLVQKLKGDGKKLKGFSTGSRFCSVASFTGGCSQSPD